MSESESMRRIADEAAWSVFAYLGESEPSEIDVAEVALLVLVAMAKARDIEADS